VFATAGRAYIEYDTNGDLHYNPTGLIRAYTLRGSNPAAWPVRRRGPPLRSQRQADPPAERTLVHRARLAGQRWNVAPPGADRSAVSPRKSNPSKRGPTAHLFASRTQSLPGAQRVVETIMLESGAVTVEDASKDMT